MAKRAKDPSRKSKRKRVCFRDPIRMRHEAGISSVLFPFHVFIAMRSSTNIILSTRANIAVNSFSAGFETTAPRACRIVHVERKGIFKAEVSLSCLSRFDDRSSKFLFHNCINVIPVLKDEQIYKQNHWYFLGLELCIVAGNGREGFNRMEKSFQAGTIFLLSNDPSCVR